MHPLTTVTLPDDLDLRPLREAARLNMTTSRVTREAIERPVEDSRAFANLWGGGVAEGP